MKRRKAKIRSQASESRSQRSEKLSVALSPRTSGSFRLRSGQREFERGVYRHRVCGLLARRQYGKTTIAGRIALRKMMMTPGHTVIFGSVKLDLGREIVRKEAEAVQRVFSMLAERCNHTRGARARGKAHKTRFRLCLVDDKGKNITEVLGKPDDFAELYEACRLEFRLRHDTGIYSRTKVVALTPAAVGETGDLILDEVGRVKNFRDVVEAVTPIISSNPEFRCIYTTTPPPDDTHYSFELLAPPLSAELPVNPKGNWYRSELGVWVLRITAWDAYADGVPLYDDDLGQELAPEQSRARAFDKQAWDRNYGCRFVLGGTAACGLPELNSAQSRGLGECALFLIAEDENAGPRGANFHEALAFIRQKLGPGPVGVGWDLATTTKATSNPSAMAVVEKRTQDIIARAVLVWKTADPAEAIERARRVVEAVGQRPDGGRARRLCVDGANERLFANSVMTMLEKLLPVEIVIGSETARAPGGEETMTMKQLLGGKLVRELEDNHLILPAERYLREDWRLVRKEQGQFVCDPDSSGRHGDTFDAVKLGLWALQSTGGALERVEGIVLGNSRARFAPRRLQMA